MAQYQMVVAYAGPPADLLAGLPEGAQLVELRVKPAPGGPGRHKLDFETTVQSEGGRRQLTPEAQAWLEAQFEDPGCPTDNRLARELGVSNHTVRSRRLLWFKARTEARG